MAYITCRRLTSCSSWTKQLNYLPLADWWWWHIPCCPAM